MKKGFLILALLITVGCSKKPPPREVKPVPVKVSQAVSKTVPLYIKTVGLMEAYTTVKVMAQANGLLLKTYFENGADVCKGDLLYLIDQRPYLASLEQAKGALEESIANYEYSQRTAARNAPLAEDEYISQNTYDQLLTTVQADEGIVQQNSAEVEEAEINLSYTTIYAPMDARAGKSIINDGNLILEEAETTLVTLNQITPIYATFYVNGKDLLRVQDYQKFGELKTIITTQDANHTKYEGPLTIIDNTIDSTTGMIKLWATLPNVDKTLWPNQYVQVELILEEIEDAVLIPTDAVQTNVKGKYVFVVKGNQTVEMRQVKVGQRQEDNLIVILDGLRANETVVTDGQINLHKGVKVKIVEGKRK